MPSHDHDRNVFTTWFRGQHAPWPISGEGPIPFIDLNYYGRVFERVDQRLPDAGLHVLATDALRGPLPVSGPDVVVLCLNDEHGFTPTYAYDVGLVVKTMGAGKRAPYVAWWPLRRWPGALLVAAQEALVQKRRLPYLSRAALGTATHLRRPPVVDVPLGIRAFYHRDLVPFDERRFDVMFAGSLVNEPGEEKRRFPTQKVRFRREFLAALDEAQRVRPAVRFSVRTVPSHWTAMQAVRAYLDELVQSRIVLCPRGSSLDTHRFFEALRFGCVPVYEVLPRRPYYRGSPAVRCADWTKLPQVLDRLLADPAGLRQRHEAALQWYADHVAPPAVAATVVEAIGRRGLAPTSAVHQ
ncbi:MAG: hypothetical protein ACJ735_01610 [Actinomycetes bacterium]